MLHKMAEEGRVAVRHARQEANKEIKRRQQDARGERGRSAPPDGEVQKLTDEYIERIDELLKAKEAEVMEV